MRKTGRKEAKTDNPYHLLLVNLYKELSEKTGSLNNKRIYKRLMTPRSMRPPATLKFIKKHMTDRTEEIAVIIATVVDDVTV